MPAFRTWMRACAGMTASAVVVLLTATVLAQRALPERLVPPQDARRPPVLDRHGSPLQLVHDGGWNLAEQVNLADVPPLLVAAVIGAEDRRFDTHAGIDWRGRAAALWQNLRAGRVVRGASTISEQVVRLLHPRERTLWSRWIEGWEAMRLERRFSKPEILEFYLNQVPYGANRRGVRPAAQYYFGRSLETLAPREMLALAVLLRAPSRLARDTEALDAGIGRLAQHLRSHPALAEGAGWQPAPLRLARQSTPLAAAHVVDHLRQMVPGGGPVHSSLDAALQADAERFLRERLHDLQREGARNGAALVVDLDGNRIRAWAVVDAAHPQTVGIDAVRVPRQPGSTLKPLLYATAFERGWSPATRIDDAPLAERVNGGLHAYRNYSRVHYGSVTVAEALGNSLNIPAVKALQFVGAEHFLGVLRRLGITGLDRHPRFYGDGLALGNGEVTLYELVQAYTALAREGRFRPLTLLEQPRAVVRDSVVFSAAAARATSAVLSDPAMRLLEFGDGGLLRFAARTAVKTGTSSDYRDAWTLAYDGRHVVGVWIGNLSGRETEGVSGARGPALLARSLLARLGETVPVRAESPGAGASSAIDVPAAPEPTQPTLRQPYDGLQLALDPRIPDELERFDFELAWSGTPTRVRWYVDGDLVGEGIEPRWSWPLRRGQHRLHAVVESGETEPLQTAAVGFVVH
ncbi:transglycosylase domain-containing protein [Sinimarinibacterium flocculans]|uniref:peptidoglycan glycosyltransferase n=1 Tax=Sinimarinibacterium flocculans TaxID=985250 RepID=A0A318EE92_9GAMM|nr:transglycosylase domain-containing protein [Sinimarinibacterium flocculans]PXV71089.1 penicillin-binding protein 1C [Sinimarinibacterium flocculans]